MEVLKKSWMVAVGVVQVVLTQLRPESVGVVLVVVTHKVLDEMGQGGSILGGKMVVVSPMMYELRLTDANETAICSHLSGCDDHILQSRSYPNWSYEIPCSTQ